MGLTFIYFCTNVLFVYAGQENFWAERRNVVAQFIERRSKNVTTPDKSGNYTATTPDKSGNYNLTAQLSANIQGSGPSQILDHLNRITTTQLSVSLSKSVQDILPQGFENKYNHILSSLPYTYGQVRNVIIPKGKPNGQTIIHIQDVHMNPEAQENIAKTLQELLDKKVANLVALEGAFGHIDINRFHSFPNREDVSTAADYMLRVNKISGAIHTALTNVQEIPPFVGIDDSRHYWANVEAYKQSVSKTKEYKKLLADLSEYLANTKTQVLNKALLEFDTKVEAYRRGKISLGEYITHIDKNTQETEFSKHNTGNVVAQFIERRSKHDTTTTLNKLSNYKNIALFLQALEMESALDFKAIDKERTALINQLTENLDKKEIAQLLNFSAAYRTGQIRYTDFYQFLQNLCRNNKIELAKFPAMQSYIKYVLISDKINAENLFKEINQMEQDVYAGLVKTKVEKELINKSQLFILTEKLLNFSLTPEEWEQYLSLRSNVVAQFIERRLNDNTATTPDKSGNYNTKDAMDIITNMSLKSFEDFYTQANIRDTAMADNFKKAMETHKATIGVVITGGFHSGGLEKHLSEPGATVITFTPKITKVDTENGSAYLSVFAQEKTPLEKLFEGDKLFVSPLQFDVKTTGTYLAALIAAIGPRTAADRFKHFFPHSEARIEGEQIGGLRQITLSNAGEKIVFVIKMSGKTIQSVIEQVNNRSLWTARFLSALTVVKAHFDSSSKEINDKNDEGIGGLIVLLRYLTWGIVWGLGRLDRWIFDSELVSAKWRDANFTTWLRNYFSPENYDTSRASYNRIYDRWVGFFPETLLVALAIAILNHYGINLKLSNVIAWSGFFLYHILEYSILKYVTSKSAPGFLKSMKFPRSPPINIFFAGLISVFSISLGFLPVSHSFLIWIVYLVPFQIHFNVNLAASSIFDNTLKSIRLPAKRTKTQGTDIAISNLGIPIEKHYGVLRFSLSRSLKQRFSGWSYNEVFETPLTLTDHLLLAIIAASFMSPSLLFVIPTIYSESVSLLLLSLASIPLFFIVTIALMAPHIKEQSDAFSVFRNYLKYRKNPKNTTVDAELLKLVNKFEASVNLGEDENNKWEISFTDNPYLLAQTDIDAKKIILNIGWIISSDRLKDRRRLAYLTAVLRNIRKAIELRRYTDKSVLELGTIHHKSIETEKGDTNIPNGRPLSYEVTSSHAETLYKTSFTELWRSYTFEISVHKDDPKSTTYSAYITDYEMKRDMMIEEMKIFEERLLDAIKSNDNDTLRFLYGAVHVFIDKRSQTSDNFSSDPKISSTRQQAKKDANLMASILANQGKVSLNPPHPHPLLKHERVTELQRGNGAYQGIYKKASTSPPVPQGEREYREKITLVEMLDAVMPRQEKLNVGELDPRPLRFINNLSDNLHAGDYRHEFLKALSRELESVGLKEMTETQVMESVLNFIGYQNTLPAKEAVVAQIKESRRLNKIPVIKAVVRRADLPALRKIVEAQREDNAIHSNHPSKLLIAPAEAGLEADLKVIASDPGITVMKKADVLQKDIIAIDLLDSLFNAWAKQNNIPVQSVSLILAIPKGFHPNPEAISNLPKDSPFRDAFLIIMDALIATPMKITDFNRITEVAIFIAQQA